MLLERLRRRDPQTIWTILLVLAFLPGAASWVIAIVGFPAGIGSDASIYTGAAATWLRGGDPWAPSSAHVTFAGPPTMLLPYAAFIPLPDVVTRLVAVALCAVLAVWAVRRLRLHLAWITFPPLFGAIVLGHVEVLVLALLVAGGAVSGLAAVLKPYAALPLVAERRWPALVVAALVVAATLLFLPWAQFVADFEMISANLALQSRGDSVFGNPFLMVVAVLALAALGPRRALWLAVPVLWPAAQPTYKAMTLPVLTPVVAVLWALPVPGATLVGVVAQAALERIDKWRALPAWLHAGIVPIAEAP